MQPISERHRTAVHEAGHAVMIIRSGRTLSLLSLGENDDSGGYFLNDDYDYDIGDEAAVWRAAHPLAKDQVLELLGGWAAVRAAGLGRAADGCASDFKKATTILRDGKLGPLKRWKRRALSIMRRPENMRAVVLVAERLETQGRLTGSDVQLIVASAVE
jgi:hypothetical protein